MPYLTYTLAGVRDNEHGNYLLPDMPDYPEGYPRQNGFKSKKKQSERNKNLEEKTDFDTDKWIMEMIQFMENHNFEKSYLEMFETEFCDDADCGRADIPELAED